MAHRAKPPGGRSLRQLRRTNVRWGQTLERRQNRPRVLLHQVQRSTPRGFGRSGPRLGHHLTPFPSVEAQLMRPDMVFYYVVRDACAGVDGYKPGRTLLYDLCQRTPEAAQAICNQRNKFGLPAGVWHLVLPHDSDKGPLEYDHRESNGPIAYERILVG